MNNKFTEKHIEALKNVDILSVLKANGIATTRPSRNIARKDTKLGGSIMDLVFDNESAGLGLGYASLMGYYPQIPTIIPQSLTRGHSKEFECYPKHCYFGDGYSSSVIAMNLLDIISDGFDIPFSFKNAEEQKKVLDGVLKETLTAKRHLIDIDKLRCDFEENKPKKPFEKTKRR